MHRLIALGVAIAASVVMAGVGPADASPDSAATHAKVHRIGKDFGKDASKDGGRLLFQKSDSTSTTSKVH